MNDWWRNRVGRGGPPVIDGRQNDWVRNRGGRNDWNSWRWKYAGSPRWGWGGGNWGPGGQWGNDWSWYWRDRYVPNRYSWYRSSWRGGWANNWYIPLLTGLAIGSYQNNSGLWGYSNTWGYGPSYYNPYYAGYVWDTTPIYDYSRPLVLNQVQVIDDGQPAPQETAEERQAQRLVDQGVAEFQAEQYAAALAYFDQALGLIPSDPVVHEVRAMTLFAMGRFDQAAIALNSLLAVAPGMDWDSALQLYGGSAAAYTAQLRALEAHVRANPDDAAARFVLAYQRLVTGYPEHAATQLQQVVRLQPDDRVAQQMLAALDPDSVGATPEQLPSPGPGDAIPAPTEAPEGAPADAATEDAAATPAMVDLIGSWRAEDPEGTVVELTVSEDSQFTWRATPENREPVVVQGNLSATSDTLMLESPDQGTMVGQVLPVSEDSFRFALVGAPPTDPGLVFTRVTASEQPAAGESL